MPNPFGKSRPVDKPYAIYESPRGWTWHVCKTYKSPESEAKDPYARWFVWAKSPMTYGSFEGGDTYRRDVMNLGRLVAADPEWIKAYGGGSVPSVAKWLAVADHLART